MEGDERVEVASPPARTASQAMGEVAVVLGLGLGLFLFAAFASLATRPAHVITFGTGEMLETLAIEVIAAALLVPWLARRGWTLAAITPPPSPRDVMSGFGVALLAYVAYVLSWITWSTFAPEMTRQAASLEFTGTVAFSVAAVFSVVNPIFEEFLELGYTVTALQRFGAGTACVVSIMIRVAVHAYQGPMALIAILPDGIVLTLYYIRTRRLWPVIVAHVIFDALALGMLVHRGGVSA
jgi:membrane protease YdiL (CAAX protease family)